MTEKNTKELEASLPAIKPAGDNTVSIDFDQEKSKKAFISREQKKDDDKKRFANKKDWSKRGLRNRNLRKKSPYEERVVAINRVCKTTKGGRKMSFNALVVVGDKKGKVGYAIAKASEVPAAIKKAIQQAQKKVMDVLIVKGDTIPHSIIGKAGSGRVFLKYAPIGTGVIAGSATRLVLEMAGIKNIYSKVQGSTTPINVVRATFNALENLKSKSQIALLRDKDIKEL